MLTSICVQIIVFLIPVKKIFCDTASAIGTCFTGLIINKKANIYQTFQNHSHRSCWAVAWKYQRGSDERSNNCGNQIEANLLLKVIIVIQKTLKRRQSINFKIHNLDKFPCSFGINICECKLYGNTVVSQPCFNKFSNNFFSAKTIFFINFFSTLSLNDNLIGFSQEISKSIKLIKEQTREPIILQEDKVDKRKQHCYQRHLTKIFQKQNFQSNDYYFKFHFSPNRCQGGLVCCPGWTMHQATRMCTIPSCRTPCGFGICRSPNLCQCMGGGFGPTCNGQGIPYKNFYIKLDSIKVYDFNGKIDHLIKLDFCYRHL